MYNSNDLPNFDSSSFEDVYNFENASNDDDEAVVDDNDDVSTGAVFKNPDTLSVNDIRIDGECSANLNRLLYLGGKDDLMVKLESIHSSKAKSKSKNKNNVNDSVKSAAKITKNIFDSTKAKLSMEIFNKINIDEVLESVGTKNNSPSNNYHNDGEQHKADKNMSSSRMINDENVLKKLAEMSMQFSNTNNSELKASNSIFSSASSSSFTSSSNNEQAVNNSSIENQIYTQESMPKNLYGSSLKIIERELGRNKSNNKSNEGQRIMSEEEMTRDLQNFLREHNIKDGNLVDTRRLDLRSSQNMVHDAKHKIYSKQNLEGLFERILLNDDRKSISKLMEGKNYKNKFLNDKPGSSSSDSDGIDEENDRTLWIERYRKQKMALANSKK